MTEPRRAARALLAWVDPLVVAILVVLALGLLLPASGTFAEVLDHLRTAAIVLLFFAYGARMSRAQIRRGLTDVRVQGSMLAATFVVFPVLGLAVQLLPDAVLSTELQRGVLYLSLLPSTVQASVVFTSVAGGNVAAAITGATVSNVVGIVATPLLVALLLGGFTSGSGSPLSADAAVSIALQLLLPFVLGQLVEPRFGPWLRAHARVTRVVDRSAILLVAYTSVSQAQVDGAWDHVTARSLVALLVVCAAVLAVMLLVTWHGGCRLGLERPDRIALLMCGSKKSLATGLPMAALLFTPAAAAAVALPVIVFHQVQLATCAAFARRLSGR